MNGIIDSILNFISKLFGTQIDHSDRITNKLTEGVSENIIHVETLGRQVYLTGQLQFESGQMPTRGNPVYLGYIPDDLLPFNDYAIVFGVYGQFQADVNAMIRMVMGTKGLQFYNSGSGSSAATIFYYATWELEKIPSGGGQ